MAQAKRVAMEKLQTLEQLERTRSYSYVWMRDELSKVAPEYRGSPSKFSLRMYIENFRRCTPALQERKPQETNSKARFNIIEDAPITIQAAAMGLFHAACPHPIHYRTEEGELDIEEFKVSLGLWMANITTIWIEMPQTRHDNDCTCCITFRKLATNYESELKMMMGEQIYEEKRVSRNTVTRWAAGLSSEGPREAMQSLASIGRALLTGEEHSMISDLTDDSSNLSDAEDMDGTLFTQTEEQYGEHLYDERTDEETVKPSPVMKTLRSRKSACRPLNTVVEISDRAEILSLAVPEIERVVQISVPMNGYTNVGRNEVCEYAKTFLQQIIKVKQLLSVYQLSSHKAQASRLKREHTAYLRTKRFLSPLLDGGQSVYTTRSRKRARYQSLELDRMLDL